MAVRRFIDIGANLTDPMYSGIYGGSKKHESDLVDVLSRSWAAGVERIIVTGGSLTESGKALELAATNPKLFATIGCHPTRCGEFDEGGDPEGYLSGLSALFEKGKGKVVAVGEIGLDYERLQFCDRETQVRHFERQLSLVDKFQLPLFLHCRGSEAAAELLDILARNRDRLCGGVVHSFDGTLREMEGFLGLGLHIGINGCSLKTEANLEVAKAIPAERLLAETDCPWCEVKPSHAGHRFVTTKHPSAKKEKWAKGSMVKGRNEPANVVQVLEVLAAVRGEGFNDLSDQVYNNTLRLFFPESHTSPPPLESYIKDCKV